MTLNQNQFKCQNQCSEPHPHRLVLADICTDSNEAQAKEISPNPIR